MLRNALFYIKEAYLSTRKNGIISLATMVSLTATLIMVGVLLLISFNIRLFMNNIESELTAVAYLKDNLPEEELLNLIQDVGKLEGVKEVRFISKDDAFQALKEDLSEHEEILAGILENPLPSSIEIFVSDASYLEDIAFQLNQYNGIEEVNYGGQLTEKLVALFRFIRRSGFAIITILIFISILIIFSVIKISVHSRQKEIEIMALVGATSWFIRWPFIIEGFLKGLISSTIGVFIIIRVYLYYIEQITRILPFVPVITDQSILLRIVIIIILLGTLIGVFGSMLSLRKISYEEV